MLQDRMKAHLQILLKMQAFSLRNSQLYELSKLFKNCQTAKVLNLQKSELNHVGFHFTYVLYINECQNRVLFSTRGNYQ